MLKKGNTSFDLWGLWVASLVLILLGFFLPVLRIPVMGQVRFHECYGCSSLSAILSACGMGVGGLISIVAGSRRKNLWAGLLLYVAGFVVLLVCMVRLVAYLAEKLSVLSTEGMDLSGVIRPGGWCLIVGSIFALLWIFWRLKRANTRGN